MTASVRKNQLIRIHFLVTSIQRASRRPTMSALMANAKGTLNDVNPMYIVGGWIVIQ